MLFYLIISTLEVEGIGLDDGKTSGMTYSGSGILTGDWSYSSDSINIATCTVRNLASSKTQLRN